MLIPILALLCAAIGLCILGIFGVFGGFIIGAVAGALLGG